MAKKSTKPARLRTSDTTPQRYAVTDKGGTMISIKKTTTGLRNLINSKKSEILVGCFSNSYMDRFNSSLAAVAASMVGSVAAELNMTDSDIDVAPESQTDMNVK